VALAVLGLDQLAKYLAVSKLTSALGQRSGLSRAAAFVSERPEPSAASSRDVLPGLLRVRYAEDPGAAWGAVGPLSPALRRSLNLLASLVALAFLLFLLARIPAVQPALILALAVMFGGAVGNFIDRLLRGYVIDFIELHWGDGPGLRWPAFNLADAAICLGLGLVVGQTLRRRPAIHTGAGPLSAGAPDS
jgi:signal peptidase II